MEAIGDFPMDAVGHLERVRRICLALPETFEKLSHGEPTFFVRKRVFTMFANDHHNDGRIAVWIPVEPGMQEALIESSPGTYFRPPYVGVNGWVGILLDAIDDEGLAVHLQEAWQQIREKSPGRKKASTKRTSDGGRKA